MATNTPNLELLKKNPTTDGSDTFNIQTMLNDNWDKIDSFAGSLDTKLAGLLHDDTKTDLLLPSDATPDDAFKILAGILGITYILASSGVTVTASSGSTTKTAVAASNGIATFKGLPYGDWTFSATISGSTKTKTLTIDVQKVRYVSLRALNDLSWAQISILCTSGAISEVFALGDTKDVSLSGIGTMTLQIADFNHDYLSSSTTASKAPVTFLCKNLLYSDYRMNSSSTNSGGFMSSALKSTLNSTILNALPSDLRSIIKTCYKWYGTGNATQNGAWGGCKIWIPLEYEILGTTQFSPTGEKTTGNARQYPIFTDSDSRIKIRNNGTGSTSPYWLASPYQYGRDAFCRVAIDGIPYYNNAEISNGVCFGLCV